MRGFVWEKIFANGSGRACMISSISTGRMDFDRCNYGVVWEVLEAENSVDTPEHFRGSTLLKSSCLPTF